MQGHENVNNTTFNANIMTGLNGNIDLKYPSKRSLGLNA